MERKDIRLIERMMALPQNLSKPYSEKIPVSVAVLTHNSEATLRQCLDSLNAFEEVLVCDGNSTDATRDIAHACGATLLDQDQRYKNPDGSIADFAGIRNQTLEAARYDWFLFIDSDEYLSLEAVQEIAHIVAQPLGAHTPRAYWLPRKRVYKGEVVACTTTYPNYQMRFFHKSGVTAFIKPVHERIEVRPETAVGYLRHPEYVPFLFEKDTWKKKLLYYINIEVARHHHQPFWGWVRMALGSMKVSLLYAFRYVRMVLFCRGHRMPSWYESLQHWYHWQLIVRTGAKYFSKTTRKI